MGFGPEQLRDTALLALEEAAAKQSAAAPVTRCPDACDGVAK